MSPRSSDEKLQLEVLSDGLNLIHTEERTAMVVLVLLGIFFLPGYSTCI